nr:hypothetical protein [Endobacter medicaginis]
MPQLAFDPVRSPRIQLLVNGQPAPGCYAATVESTAHLQAARWTAEVAVGAGMSAADWSALPAPSTVEIRASLDGVSWVSLVTGDIDDLHLDVENGVVSLSGRDLSARFLDTKTSNAWPNSTSSQIATYLAGLRGLQANVVSTSTPVGQYYQLEHSRVTAGSFSKFSNEWELLCYLAREENYVVSVSGQTLNFVPRTQAGT